LATGVVLAQNYKLIEEFVESPQGRIFLADDLSRKRRVSLLVLSPDFLSDGTRLASLEEAVQMLRDSPHPVQTEPPGALILLDGTPRRHRRTHLRMFHLELIS
jgi:hypothetical protein